MCGVSGRRYQPLEKEISDLAALQRGVFAKRDLQSGEKIDHDDIYFAFPCQPGQLLTNKVSKYASIVISDKEIKKNEPLQLTDIYLQDDTEYIQSLVRKVM